MRKLRLNLAVFLAAIVPLSGACARDTTSGPAHCAEASNCWTVQFAFINFTGQRAELYIDGDLVLDEPLDTANWSTALSRSLIHPVSGSTSLKLKIDGVAVYDGHIASRQIRTIYIDARSSSALEQTDHPAPLLD
jgi:hypothetical protein